MCKSHKMRAFQDLEGVGSKRMIPTPEDKFCKYPSIRKCSLSVSMWQMYLYLLVRISAPQCAANPPNNTRTRINFQNEIYALAKKGP